MPVEEGGWGWMVVAGSFVFHSFSLGTHKVFGVFIPRFSEALDINECTVGTICGIATGVKCILGPLWSMIATRFNARTITALSGIMTGLGFIGAGISTSEFHLGASLALTGIGLGLPSVVVLKIIREYFDIKFSLATGIAFTGSAIGMTMFPPLFDKIIDVYGWRAASILLGAMSFNICVSAALFRPPRTSGEETTPLHDNSNNDTNEDCSMFRSIVHQPNLTIYFVSFALHGITYSGWVLFLVSYAVSLGFSSASAAFFSTMGGLGTLVGRALAVSITNSDTDLMSGHAFFFLLTVGGSLSLMLYPFVKSFNALIIVSLLVGLFVGTQPPIMVLFTRELTSSYPDDFVDALGTHYLFIGVGLVAGGPQTGFLYNATGSYHLPLFCLAAVEILAALLVAVNAPFLYYFIT